MPMKKSEARAILENIAAAGAARDLSNQALDAALDSLFATALQRIEPAGGWEPETPRVMWAAGFDDWQGNIGMWAGPCPRLDDILREIPMFASEWESRVPVIVRFEGDESRITHLWIDGTGWTEVGS
jgi:hypothetical protein